MAGRHHATSRGVWLITAKRGSGRSTIPYEAVVEEALCFGWIDSLPRSLDDERSMRLLTPRKPTSNWSRVNKQRVEKLIAEGRMTPAGRHAVDAAKASGRWQALDAVEALTVPPDLAHALLADPAAAASWEAFPRSAKRAILEWIAAAKRPETRAGRVATTVSEAAAGRRANQWRPYQGARLGPALCDPFARPAKPWRRSLVGTWRA
jgi:uncharacterized protein YdeI (YjbR/CyaY-like superfamily)